MKWEASEAYQVSSLMKTFNPLFCKTLRETLFQEYLGFIQMIGDAIANKKIRDESVEKSLEVTKFVDLLENLSNWIDEIKPVEQRQRFGNKAFKEWHSKLMDVSKILVLFLETLIYKQVSLLQESEKLLGNLVTEKEAIKEIQVYLHDSFGNSTRIDYGTGHEMAFVMFLACLFHVGFFNIKKDLPAVGLIVFDKYMKVVRKLQMTYRMEPAGSQGVRILPLF